MKKNLVLLTAFITSTILIMSNSVAAPPSATEAKVQVEATERGFAMSMAKRSLSDFSAYISDEAVFFTGPTPLRGKIEIMEWWARYFTSATAPFSWGPEDVEVLDSGTLALSSGPVRNQNGKLVARFTSIWRFEPPGIWRIIFDRGDSICSNTCQ